MEKEQVRFHFLKAKLNHCANVLINAQYITCTKRHQDLKSGQLKTNSVQRRNQNFAPDHPSSVNEDIGKYICFT